MTENVTTFDTAKVMNEEAKELATVQTSASIASFADNLMTDVYEQGYWASFNVETMEDKKVLYSARNDNLLLRDYMDTPINVAGFVIDSQTINDSQVGAKRVPCVHIITQDGKVYQSASTGVVNSACDIISSFGTPDTWTEDIIVVCKETTTKSGNRFKYLAVQ